MAEKGSNFVRYNRTIRVIFLLHILAGLGVTIWLLSSERVWLPKDDGVYIDRLEDPYLFWFLTLGIFLALVAWPTWELWRGGTYRK
jgi:hypothetical protein